MKKNIATIVTAIFVILCTSVFAIAEGAMTTASNFPYFHLGALLIGGLILVSLQQKYNKIRVTESMGSFALYAVMISLFTEPVVNAIRSLIG